MNKLGINEYKLRDIERKIVNLKLNLLDYYFTFNLEKYDLNYLLRLHIFLFGDIYYEEDLSLRKLEQIEIDLINDYMSKIQVLSSDPSNINIIIDLISKIYTLHPFKNGNTRTLYAFLKIINEEYLLGLDVDVNKDIKSGLATFNINRFVNQKRLTK